MIILIETTTLNYWYIYCFVKTKQLIGRFLNKEGMML
jgi:hypothetical protein